MLHPYVMIVAIHLFRSSATCKCTYVRMYVFVHVCVHVVGYYEAVFPFTAATFGIALPSWIVSKENSGLVLAIYVGVFMVALPIAIVSVVLAVCTLDLVCLFVYSSLYMGDTNTCKYVLV